MEIIPASTGQMLRQPCAELWQRSCQLQFSFARLDRVAFREERLRKRRRAARESKKVIEVAFLANVAIAIRKYVAALTGSSAMLAESLHATADTGNELLLLVGMKPSSRPPDEFDPYGHGKALYFIPSRYSCAWV